MATLEITLDLNFETGALVARNDDTCKNESLVGAAARTLFEAADPKALSLYVAALDPEEGWPSVGFEFDKKSLKKGTFEVELKADGSGLIGTAKGTFLLKLRAGVAPMLQGYGDKLDLRLQGISYKGGSFNGFISNLAGQVDDAKKWHQIAHCMIK